MGLFAVARLDNGIRNLDPEIAADAQDQQGIAPVSTQDPPLTKLTIGEAKQGLAEALGITPDKIEIIIRT